MTLLRRAALESEQINARGVIYICSTTHLLKAFYFVAAARSEMLQGFI